MKKIFTLAVSAMIALAAAATTPTTIFSYVLTDNGSLKGNGETAIDFSQYGELANGGSMTMGATTSNVMNKGLLVYKTSKFCITLGNDLKLQTGDIISFSSNATEAKDLAYAVVLYPTEKRVEDISTANNYTVTDGDIINGCSSFYFSGTDKSSNRVWTITVVRPQATTGIDGIQTAATGQTKAKKCVKDGRIVIMRDGVEYDTLGRRIR